MTLHQTGARQRIGGAFLWIDNFKGRAGVNLIDRLKGQSQPNADLTLNEQLDWSAAGFRKLLDIEFQLVNISQCFFFSHGVHQIFEEEIAGATGFRIRHGNQIIVFAIQQILIGFRFTELMLFQDIRIDD